MLTPSDALVTFQVFGNHVSLVAAILDRAVLGEFLSTVIIIFSLKVWKPFTRKIVWVSYIRCLIVSISFIIFLMTKSHFVFSCSVSLLLKFVYFILVL